MDADSRARTHLANERTYLAWLRTSITFISLGLAAAQFLTKGLLPGVPIVTAMALCLVGCGVFVALAGTFEFVRGRREIDQGSYRSSRYMIFACSAIVVLIGLVGLIFIVLLRRGS